MPNALPTKLIWPIHKLANKVQMYYNFLDWFWPAYRSTSQVKKLVYFLVTMLNTWVGIESLLQPDVFTSNWKIISWVHISSLGWLLLRLYLSMLSSNVRLKHQGEITYMACLVSIKNTSYAIVLNSLSNRDITSIVQRWNSNYM